MADLLEHLILKKEVIAFPIHEYWIDIGQKNDFHRAQVEYSSFFRSTQNN